MGGSASTCPARDGGRRIGGGGGDGGTNQRFTGLSHFNHFDCFQRFEILIVPYIPARALKGGTFISKSAQPV